MELLGTQCMTLTRPPTNIILTVYIGVNMAVHPPKGELDGNSIFAIICVYLFVVFYSFGKLPHPHPSQ